MWYIEGLAFHLRENQYQEDRNGASRKDIDKNVTPLNKLFDCYIISSFLMSCHTFSYLWMQQKLKYYVQYLTKSSYSRPVQTMRWNATYCIINPGVLFIIYISFWDLSILFYWTKFPFPPIPNFRRHTCHQNSSFLPENRW